MDIEIETVLEAEDGSAFSMSVDEQKATIVIDGADGERAGGDVRFHRHEMLNSIDEAVSYCERDPARGSSRYRCSKHRIESGVVLTVSSSQGRTHLACHKDGVGIAMFPLDDGDASISLRRDLREAAALLRKRDDAFNRSGR